MIDEVITYLVKGLHFLVQSYWGALFFALFGIYFIRTAVKERTITSNNLRGWAGGIALIVGGLLILIFKLTGKI